MLDAEAILRLLKGQAVDFVVIGGLAMITHGSAHITQDLDVCYRRTPENLAALATALSSIHPYLRSAPPGLPFKLDAATLAAGLNFTLDTDLGPLDLMGEVAGIGGYDAVVALSTHEPVYGLRVQVLSLEGLSNFNVLVPGLRWLQACFFEQVSAIVHQVKIAIKRKAIDLAVI